MIIVRSSSRLRAQALAGIALALLASGFTSVTHAEGSPSGSTAFSPQPITQDRFEVGPPEPNFVRAPDDADMYVEVFRPARVEKGPPVPARVPVILLMSPYEGEGLWDPTAVYHQWRDYFVKKGYAFAISHVYGTGSSEGCLEYLGPNELAATSAVIEHLGSRSWSNGAVGMFGTSYDGGHALHAAARSSGAAKKYLRAVVSEAGFVSAYDISGHDGVPFGGSSTTNFLSYAPVNHMPSLTNEAPLQVDPTALAERQVGACRVENGSAQIEFEANGDFAEWFSERSARSGANRVRAATLMFQGLHDWQVTPIAPVGFFDRIPQNVPHNLVLGQWQHARTLFHRADWMSMIHAWFDRHLLELPTHTETWPEVQIQDSEGVWRYEVAWPNPKNPAGQLALGAEGRLGMTEPSGSTSFYEGGAISSGVGAATFTTPPLTSPLRLAGLPVLDLWTTIDRDDAHIAATLRAFDAEGNLITSQGGIAGDSVGRFPITAYRSLQHLKPLVDGEFRQSKPEPAPLEVPLHVPVRFFVPVDLVVPDGGRLTITISGTSLPDHGGAPSGSGAKVEILHDCATNHASVLRFLMPDPGRSALSVTEGPDPIAPSGGDPNPVALTGPPSEPGSNDGGIASDDVCGKKPMDPFRLWNHGG